MSTRINIFDKNKNGLSRAKVYIHQNLLKVVVHVMIIAQRNQTARLYEIQVTVIYSRAILAALMSECHVKKVICKTWIGTLANNVGSALFA